MRRRFLLLTSACLFCGVLTGGCGARSSRGGALHPAEETGSIEVPLNPSATLLPRQVVARGLQNPRGLLVLADGALLVAEAGSGAPGNELSGGLARLKDVNADGDFMDEGERHPVLESQPSKNILEIVRRDEVFGMAGIDTGEGKILAALAFFGGPSTIFQVEGDRVTRWGSTHGNINDLAYDPKRKRWFAAASTTDEIVRLVPGGGAERVLKLPPLTNGQDAVPGYVNFDFVTGEILVSLFTGSPEGEEGGLGVELVARAGGIIAVDPDRKRFRWLITGLSVPTDFAIASDGTIYVLEFCDAFVEPVGTREAMAQGPTHGGFRRFSGRLLRIDRKRRSVTVIAQGLDAPTNLTLFGGFLYIAEGMGTPGREIPGPAGSVQLEGFIERIAIAHP